MVQKLVGIGACSNVDASFNHLRVWLESTYVGFYNRLYYRLIRESRDPQHVKRVATLPCEIFGLFVINNGQ